MVEREYGKARRVWVFDRGIVSEENLAALRKRGGQYLVGSARRKLKEFERELLEGGWEQVRPEVDVKLASTPGGEETYVLCRTAARKEKEQAIRSRFSTQMETALKKLQKRVAEERLKDRHKIERQIGRIQALGGEIYLASVAALRRPMAASALGLIARSTATLTSAGRPAANARSNAGARSSGRSTNSP
jgi:hypothetical protein